MFAVRYFDTDISSQRSLALKIRSLLMSPSRLCRFAVFQYKPTFPTSSAGEGGEGGFYFSRFFISAGDQKDVFSGIAKTEEGDSQNSAEGAAFTTKSRAKKATFSLIMHERERESSVFAAFAVMMLTQLCVPTPRDCSRSIDMII